MNASWDARMPFTELNNNNNNNNNNYFFNNNNHDNDNDSFYSIGDNNNITNNSINADRVSIRADHQVSTHLGDHVYATIGGFMTLLIIFGFLENSMVLYVYAKNRTLRTHRNAFLVGLAVDDLAQSFLNIPFVCVSAFNHKWAFGEDMCQYYGFITCMLGLTQISILTVIALDRYLLIMHQKRVFSDSPRAATCTIVACFVNGALWGIGPLIGWSRYKREAGNVSCGIDWDLQDAGNLSFVASLFLCLWFLPLAILIYSYSYIIHMLFKERGRRTFVKARKENSSKERKVAVTCLIMTGFFVITWLPYSVVSLWSALGDISTIPVPVQMSSAFVAKSAIIWNPIIYFIRHSHFRSACANSIGWIRFVFKARRESSSNGTGLSRKNDTNMTEIGARSTLIMRKNRPGVQQSQNKSSLQLSQDLASLRLSQNRDSVQQSRKNNMNLTEVWPRSAPSVRKNRLGSQQSQHNLNFQRSHDQPSLDKCPDRKGFQLLQNRTDVTVEMSENRQSDQQSQNESTLQLSQNNPNMSQQRNTNNAHNEVSQDSSRSNYTAPWQRRTASALPEQSQNNNGSVATWKLSQWTTPITRRELSQILTDARETVV